MRRRLAQRRGDAAGRLLSKAARQLDVCQVSSLTNCSRLAGKLKCTGSANTLGCHDTRPTVTLRDQKH
eukprot:3863679-Rhodomonas_salina.1